MAETLTCFLIDDDQDDREIFAIALDSTEADVVCDTAKNGLHGLEKLTADTGFTPDYIFIDLNMPFVNGVECLKKIKGNNRLKNIPAIIYTTSSRQKDVEETKKLGASHFVVKPNSLNSLIDILSAILKKEKLPFLISDNSIQ